MAEQLHTRPPLARMLRIHQAIQEGKYPTAASLAASLEVSSKSIHRDLEFMRDRLQLPLEWDPRRFGYFYTETVNAFPQTLPDTISLNLAEIEQTISFRTRAEPILDLNIFEALAKATAERQQLELTYRKPGQKQTELRIIDPYHLANINGEWFLFAFDHLRKDIRTFVPARVKAIRPTGESFSRPESFSPEKQLRDSFGVHSGQREYEVVIRFNERAADYIREKKWHDSQRLRDLKTGGVELRLKLSSLTEVERWVLNWGGDAVVVKPQELCQAVRQSAQKLLKAH